MNSGNWTGFRARVRSKARELEKVITSIESEKRAPATDEEIARKMNLSIPEYQDLLREVGSTTLLSLDEGVYNDEGGQASLHEVIEGQRRPQSGG